VPISNPIELGNEPDALRVGRRRQFRGLDPGEEPFGADFGVGLKLKSVVHLDDYDVHTHRSQLR